MGPKKNKKRNNPRNDFYFFMQDQKKVFMAEGRPWDSMEELVALCSPRWAQLPDTDRQRYKDMAKKHKEEERKDLSRRFDHTGRSLQDIENERRAAEEAAAAMRAEVDAVVGTTAANATIVKETFVLVNFSTLCEVNVCSLCAAGFSS